MPPTNASGRRLLLQRRKKERLGKSGKVLEEKDDRLVEITFGDDTADDPAPAPPDFLLLLLVAATFFELFFSSVSLSLSRDSLDSTLSTLELRVLRGTLELSFDKFDFFAGGFFELGGTFTGCWWLVLLPFTWKRFRWLLCGHSHDFFYSELIHLRLLGQESWRRRRLL